MSTDLVIIETLYASLLFAVYFSMRDFWPVLPGHNHPHSCTLYMDRSHYILRLLNIFRIIHPERLRSPADETFKERTRISMRSKFGIFLLCTRFVLGYILSEINKRGLITLGDLITLEICL